MAGTGTTQNFIRCEYQINLYGNYYFNLKVKLIRVFCLLRQYYRTLCLFSVSGSIGTNVITNQIYLSSNYEQLIIPNIVISDQNEIELNYTYRFQALNLKTISI